MLTMENYLAKHDIRLPLTSNVVVVTRLWSDVPTDPIPPPRRFGPHNSERTDPLSFLPGLLHNLDDLVDDARIGKL